MLSTLFFVFLFFSFVKADDNWDDFTNNLATDLAPLITLFGERLTKQFLSESISALDNVIFALSPLGVLTAVVSVIRICGSSSLRAFVGRAQEGPAEAECELLPCVSESTAELFNDGGITRVFGRPKIMEIIAWEEKDENTGKKSTKIGNLKEALKARAWSCKGEILPSELPELDIPNLSLNKGIKRRGQVWFYCAAVFGCILQIGTILYAALTVFVYPEHFKKDDKAVASYAFPFYLIGTTLLFIGMFFCAFIMKRSSKEYYLRPEKPSKIYWVQPGNQDVGDQVFNAFLAVKEGPESSMTTELEYIKSIRDRTFDRKYLEIYSTLASTLLGFIFQFIGLRGLHASVILAQLGSTFLMAVIRTCLRTERMAPDENKMKDKRQLTSHKQQELDCFAFHLDRVETFDLASVPDQPANMPSPRFTPHLGTSLTKQIIGTRIQLARLTSSSGQSSNVNWDDMPIRQVARKLAKAIESTMDLISSWGVELGPIFEFRLAFKCKISLEGAAQPPGTYSIGLIRCGDVLRWKIEVNELEAVLGLWTWSLYKSDKSWLDSTLCRLVGLDENEASKEETYLYFHKWIFRQTEARLVNSNLIDKTRLFGFEPEANLPEETILAMRTNNELEKMTAQDIFVQFLKEAMINVKELGGDIDVLPGIQNSFVASSTRINELVSEFEDSGLGSREDALLCIVPVLRKRGLLPDLAADTPMVRTRIGKLITQGKWKYAFSLFRWLCERSEESELERSVYELGYLCRQALLSNNPTVRSEGVEQTCRLLKSDIRDEFLEPRKDSLPSDWTKSQYRIAWWGALRAQLGWVAWEISKENPGMKPTQKILKSLGVKEALGSVNDAAHETEDLQTSMRAFGHWLTVDSPDFGGGIPSFGDGDEICFDWAVRNNHYALLYFLLLKWIEMSEKFPDLTQIAYALAAKNRSHWAIQVLLRYNADIDTLDTSHHTALIQRIAFSDLVGARMLIEYGADANGGGDKHRAPKPLLAAIQMGHVDMMELILQLGASPDIVDSSGLSAIWWASRSGEIEIMNTLLRHGAEINQIEHDETPLMFAASKEQIDMLAFLIENGADINACDRQGRTALMSAGVNANSQVLQLLITKGADVHMRDKEDLTALDLVKKEEQKYAAILQSGHSYHQHSMGSVDIDWTKKQHSFSLYAISILEPLYCS